MNEHNSKNSFLHSMTIEDFNRMSIEYKSSVYVHPLLDAAKLGNSEDETLIKKLIEFKVTLNITDRYGRTPLMLAAQNGHTTIVELLLKNGADPNIQSDIGNTPLHYVCGGKP
jgi:ankyrin repeat protein